MFCNMMMSIFILCFCSNRHYIYISNNNHNKNQADFPPSIMELSSTLGQVAQYFGAEDMKHKSIGSYTRDFIMQGQTNCKQWTMDNIFNSGGRLLKILGTQIINVFLWLLVLADSVKKIPNILWEKQVPLLFQIWASVSDSSLSYAQAMPQY